MKKHYVKIVRVVTSTDERASLSRTSFSWSSTDVHAITGECGHVKVKRGGEAPKAMFLCKRCKQGRARVPIEGELGRFDRRRSSPRSPLAAMLVPGGS